MIRRLMLILDSCIGRLECLQVGLLLSFVALFHKKLKQYSMYVLWCLKHMIPLTLTWSKPENTNVHIQSSPEANRCFFSAVPKVTVAHSSMAKASKVLDVGHLVSLMLLLQSSKCCSCQKHSTFLQTSPKSVLIIVNAAYLDAVSRLTI